MVPVVKVSEAAFDAIKPITGAIVARSITQVAVTKCSLDVEYASSAQVVCLVDAMESGIRSFVAEEDRAQQCIVALRNAVAGMAVGGAPSGGAEASRGATPPSDDFRRIEIREEYDIVTARGCTREVCAALGFQAVEQVKVATIVSELARNIIAYAGRGAIELRALRDGRRGIEVRAVDRGPGIPDIEHVMSSEYSSRTGMGIGLVGTKRLMDEFEIDSAPGRGTTIVARKYV